MSKPVNYSKVELNPRALNTDKVFEHELNIFTTLGKYEELIETLNGIAGEKHKDWRMSRPKTCGENGELLWPIDIDQHLSKWNVTYAPILKLAIRIRFKSKEAASIFKLTWEG
jgi:hypothetical protein